jgi:hypothetical protein
MRKLGKLEMVRPSSQKSRELLKLAGNDIEERLVIKLPRSEHAQIHAYAAARSMTVKDLVRALLRREGVLSK